MMQLDVQNTGRAQRERLAHIDFRLFFFGEVSCADISKRFDVAPAVATRDLARYRMLAPKNMQFDGSSKTYRVEHRLLRDPFFAWTRVSPLAEESYGA